MTASAIPVVIDGLLRLADEHVESATVYDGYGVTEEPGDFIMIGVEDPDVEDFAQAVSAEQEWPHVGTGPRHEEADITCAALSWNGDGDQGRARRDAFAILDAFADALREHRDLDNGGAMFLEVEPGTNVQLTQAQGKGGASALVAFQVHYRARF